MMTLFTATLNHALLERVTAYGEVIMLVIALIAVSYTHLTLPTKRLV